MEAIGSIIVVGHLGAIAVAIGGGLITTFDHPDWEFIVGWVAIGAAVVLLICNAVIRPKVKKPEEN